MLDVIRPDSLGVRAHEEVPGFVVVGDRPLAVRFAQTDAAPQLSTELLRRRNIQKKRSFEQHPDKGRIVV